MGAKPEKNNRKAVSVYLKVCLGLILFILLFNILSTFSTAFSDWYALKIFPLYVNTYGRFSSLFPFAVGDILIVLTIVMFLSGLLMLLLSPFFKDRVWRITKKYWKFMFVYVLVIIIILSMNWLCLYHTTSLKDKEVPEGREYTNVEYARVYNYLVDHVNELYEKVSRDENGIPKYTGDLNQEAIALVKSMAALYPQLSGYYPDFKYMGFSDIFTQNYICGYYFPVTMEANINKNMNEIMLPVTICHELIHLKGIIREDEATYLSVLACMSSSNDFIKYSGYLEALDYFKGQLPKMPDYVELHKVNEAALEDWVFVTKEKMNKIEEDSLLSTEFVNNVGSSVMDSSLKLNGVEEGIGSYREMVTLLLHFFLD